MWHPIGPLRQGALGVIPRSRLDAAGFSGKLTNISLSNVCFSCVGIYLFIYVCCGRDIRRA